MTDIALLTTFKLAGVELSVAGDALRFRAPAGALTPELKHALTGHKGKLLALLERGSPVSILVDELRRRGCELRVDGGRLICRSPRRKLPRELQDALKAFGKEVVALLRGHGTPAQTTASFVNVSAVPETADLTGVEALLPPAECTAMIGDMRVAFQRPWPGEVMAGDVIALDTETTLIEGVEVPTLALASASSGAQHVLIHPGQLGAFLLAHRDRRFVGQNVAFDFWVVERHLRERGETEALHAWWAVADEDRLSRHDVTRHAAEARPERRLPQPARPGRPGARVRRAGDHQGGPVPAPLRRDHRAGLGDGRPGILLVRDQGRGRHLACLRGPPPAQHRGRRPRGRD
jgi:hypothetical protein